MCYRNLLKSIGHLSMVHQGNEKSQGTVQDKHWKRCVVWACMVTIKVLVRSNSHSQAGRLYKDTDTSEKVALCISRQARVSLFKFHQGNSAQIQEPFPFPYGIIATFLRESRKITQNHTKNNNKRKGFSERTRREGFGTQWKTLNGLGVI